MWGEAGDDRERVLCYLRATRKSDAGMVWGSLVHALFEHGMRGLQQDRAQLERLANWLTMERPELHYLVPEALDTVEHVMDSEFLRRAQPAVERQVEVPFAVRIGDGATPTILHGVIDLAFRQPDGRNLADSKTDRADMEVLERQYAAQANSYAAQSVRLTGGSVFHAGLFSVRLRGLSRSLSGVARSQE